MQQIEYRVSGLLVFIISRWGIYGHAACRSKGGTVIPYFSYSSVSYIINLVIVTLTVSGNEDIHYACYIPVYIYIVRVKYLQSVYKERVAVKFGGKRLCGIFPYTILFRHIRHQRHVVLIDSFCREKVSGHLDSDCFRR